MIKTLSKAQKMEREKFRIPRSVQDAIPIRRIFADGIFQVGNQYSKTWSFTDINYAIASKEDKTSMFLDYSELLNALDSGASAKITIYNRRINKAEFERSVLLPDKADGLDEYRHEFNKMLTAQVTGTSNSIVRERYLTVSVVKRNADEARSYFARVGTDLVTHLAQLSSVAQELTLTERLHIFRDFFKAGEQAAAEFNIHEHAKRGQHFKDWFCPDSMEFAADHFKVDARYGRVLYLQDYASYIKDSFVSELCDLDRDLMLSIDILPVPTDEAARQLQSTLLGVETNVANWQRRQNANNNFTATIPYDMELQRKETKEMLDDLTTRDQRMMFGLVTLVHLADSKEQLDSDTETLYSTARKHLCQLSTLRWQQKDGLDTVLPYGLRKIQALRTLTTESTAVLIPFRAQEIMQPNGLYYGQNAVIVEVSDEIVEAFLLDKRAEAARDRKMFRYKAFYSLDCNDGIENAAIGWAQSSPEDHLIEKEELAEYEELIRRLYEAISSLPPMQARRVHARYMLGMKVKDIAAMEGITPSQAGKSIHAALRRLRRYFARQKWTVNL